MRDEKLRRFYKALGDRTRFDIVEELGRRGEEVPVTELGLVLGVTQPLMSWHVRVLRGVGVVTTRRQGRQVFCSLDRQSIAAYHERLDALLAGRPPSPAPSPSPAAPEPVAPKKVPLPS